MKALTSWQVITIFNTDNCSLTQGKLLLVLQAVYWYNFNLYFDLADMRKPKLVAEIAKQLRRFHEVEIPGSKEPQLWVDIFKFFEKGLRTNFFYKVLFDSFCS